MSAESFQWTSRQLDNLLFPFRRVSAYLRQIWPHSAAQDKQKQPVPHPRQPLLQLKVQCANTSCFVCQVMGKYWRARQHMHTGYPYSPMRIGSHVHVVRPRIRHQDSSSLFIGKAPGLCRPPTAQLAFANDKSDKQEALADPANL